LGQKQISELHIQEVPKGQPSTLVLVVEDDARVRVVSVALLRELGYSVVSDLSFHHDKVAEGRQRAPRGL
jgi:CheY-like chemotaxis protein